MLLSLSKQTEKRITMKNFKKAYEAEIYKLRILFPSETREELEQMFVVMMRREKPLNLDCSVSQLEERLINHTA